MDILHLSSGLYGVLGSFLRVVDLFFLMHSYKEDIGYVSASFLGARRLFILKEQNFRNSVWSACLETGDRTRASPAWPTAGPGAEISSFLQDGGLRGLPYQVLQPQSQEADRAAEHDGRRWLSVPPADATAQAEEARRLLHFRGERREGEDGPPGEVPRKSRSTSSPSKTHFSQSERRRAKSSKLTTFRQKHGV